MSTRAWRNADKPSSQRIVVTGMGIVITTGENVAEYRDSLMAGRSGITRWKQMDERCYSKVGGDMSDFDLATHFARVGASYPDPLKERAHTVLRATPLPAQLACAASLQAYLDAALPDSRIEAERVGHIFGGSNLNNRFFFENTLEYDQDPEWIDPLSGVVLPDADVLGKIGELLSIKGPNFIIGNACSSGNVALLTAADLLRAGRADAIVVSAASQEMDPLWLQGWALVNALVWRSFADEPQRASRPWDRHREGFVPGQGAGAVILETLDGALAREASIHAELLGGALTSDATRLPKPIPEGQMRVMRAALDDARLNPEQIDYINAHATSTIVGDSVEAQAIKAVFGEHAYHIPINATKSMIGHCLTAASMVELVTTLVQMKYDFLHPTINLDEPEFDLDFVPHEGRAYRFETAMSNSFGFHGLNACVIVGRAP